MKTIIVWFRNDLRVHDHPALATAAADADRVIPLFVLNQDILEGRHAGSNRNRFLLESLQDLKTSLKHLGADLVIRQGDAAGELVRLVQEHGADAVYYTSDFTSYAIRRDKRVKSELDGIGVTLRGFAGRLTVGAIDKLHTKAGTTHRIFTPFYKNWLTIGRRQLATVPAELQLPAGISVGHLPDPESLTVETDLSPEVLAGGETKARKRLQTFLRDDISDYHQGQNDMAADRTSRLSSYFHFGCLSPLEAESLLPDNNGARAWQRQLCWRDFYHYTLLHNPDNAVKEYQQRFRKLDWNNDEGLLTAWQQGKTGYPAVDAAMRQLRREGWMHNRARLIVGSFLTKDLWLDWRLGESYFMRLLTDGDEANNNGNWQWIASVGVDPAPAFRRLYNPASQGRKYDPSGQYIRRYLPELKDVPDKYLYEPWTMNQSQQQAANCIIGKDYPAPIVDHKEARLYALEQYRSAGNQ